VKPRFPVKSQEAQFLIQRSDMKLLLASVLAMMLSTASARAQSLKPEAPAALQPGINKGVVDNFVGTHYWYFTGGPGETRVHAQFKSMGLLGNPYKADVTFALYDEAKTWRQPKVLSSDSKTVDYNFTGQLKKPTKIIVSVAPPAGGLVRMGGDYELEVTGAAAFGQQSSVDPIIGTYKEMAGYSTDLGDCTFLANGNIQTTSGATGDWKVFDKDTQTYVINIVGQDRHSLQLSTGRGLVDGQTLIFQQLR
jgi:hypothetical protein